MNEQIKKFGTWAAWNAYAESQEMVTPNVSFVEEEQKVYYTPMNEAVVIEVWKETYTDEWETEHEIVRYSVTEMRVKPGFFDVQPALRDVPFRDGRMAFLTSRDYNAGDAYIIPMVRESDNPPTFPESYPSAEEILALLEENPEVSTALQMVDAWNYLDYRYNGTPYQPSGGHEYYNPDGQGSYYYMHLLYDLEQYRIAEAEEEEDT